MTTITFERTGGFAGQPIQMQVDLDTLPNDQAQKLQSLLLTSHFFEIPETIPGMHRDTPSADEFRYDLTVEANRSRHSVRTTDSTAPDNLRPLIDELSRLAKARSR